MKVAESGQSEVPLGGAASSPETSIPIDTDAIPSPSPPGICVTKEQLPFLSKEGKSLCVHSQLLFLMENPLCPGPELPRQPLPLPRALRAPSIPASEPGVQSYQFLSRTKHDCQGLNFFLKFISADPGHFCTMTVPGTDAAEIATRPAQGLRGQVHPKPRQHRPSDRAAWTRVWVAMAVLSAASVAVPRRSVSRGLPTL